MKLTLIYLSFVALGMADVAAAEEDLPCEGVGTAIVLAAEDISQNVGSGSYKISESRPLGKVPNAYGYLNKWQFSLVNNSTKKTALYQIHLVNDTCVVQSLKRIKRYN